MSEPNRVKSKLKLHKSKSVHENLQNSSSNLKNLKLKNVPSTKLNLESPIKIEGPSTPSSSYFNYVQDIAEGISQAFISNEFSRRGSRQSQKEARVRNSTRARSRSRSPIFFDDNLQNSVPSSSQPRRETDTARRKNYPSARDFQNSDSHALRNSIFTVSIFVLAFVILISVYAVYLGFREVRILFSYVNLQIYLVNYIFFIHSIS